MLFSSTFSIRHMSTKTCLPQDPLDEYSCVSYQGTRSYCSCKTIDPEPLQPQFQGDCSEIRKKLLTNTIQNTPTQL